MTSESLPIELGSEPVETVSVKRGKTPIILASAVAVALVLGIGVYVGYRLIFGGAKPAERMPASTVAYVSFDLTAGAEQSSRLSELIQKLPANKNKKDLKSILDELFGELDIDGIDPKRDITSWMGMRLGIGAWAWSGGDTYALIAASSTDDGAAIKGLTAIRDKADGHMGFVMRDGYALVAVGEKKAQAAAEAAAEEAAKAPLSGAQKFVDAGKWLEGEQLVVAFVDYGQLGNLMSSFEDQFRGMAEFEELKKSFKGTFISGVRIESGAVVVKARSFGMGGPAVTASDALAKLAALPGDSDIAAAITVPEELADSPLAGFALPFALTPPFISDPGTKLTAAEEKELDGLMAKENPTADEQARIDELMEKMFGGPTLSPEEQEELNELLLKQERTPEEERRLLDLLSGPNGGVPGPSTEAFDDIFKALAGATLTVSINDLALDPTFQAVASLRSAPSERVVASLTELAGDQVEISAGSRSLTVSSPGFARSGRLGDSALFKRVSESAPGNLAFAAFIDLTQIVPANERDAIRPFQAVGIFGGSDGGDTVFEARVLFG